MAVIDFNKKHLTPHRRNIITSFVDCARKIINEDGIEAVTIKKLGECTDLNPATIYNYFDNVDHLLYFAKLDIFDDFNNDLANWVKEGDDPLMVYRNALYLPITDIPILSVSRGTSQKLRKRRKHWTQPVSRPKKQTG